MSTQREKKPMQIHKVKHSLVEEFFGFVSLGFQLLLIFGGLYALGQLLY